MPVPLTAISSVLPTVSATPIPPAGAPQNAQTCASADAYIARVLSSAKIGTASWRYYANQVGRGACEYFLGVGEAPGRWYGRGLDPLGLTASDRVGERELEALFGFPLP